jgi:hypothetical protein
MKPYNGTFQSNSQFPSLRNSIQSLTITLPYQLKAGTWHQKIVLLEQELTQILLYLFHASLLTGATL